MRSSSDVGTCCATGAYDLVIKVHTRTPRVVSVNTARYFRRYQVENLLSSPGYVANVLGLFQREPGSRGRLPADDPHRLRRRPVAAWVALPQRAPSTCAIGSGSAFRSTGSRRSRRSAACGSLDRTLCGILRDASWEYSRLRRDATRQGRRPRPRAGATDRRSRRASSATTCRTILNAEHAAISHASLEYKVDQLSATTPGYPVEQIQFLHRAGWAGHGGIVALVRMYVNLQSPTACAGVRAVTRPVASSRVASSSPCAP